MNKTFDEIRKQVDGDLKTIKDSGFKSLKCDNYNKDHFLKLVADSLYTKSGEILCRNCILEKEQ